MVPFAAVILRMSKLHYRDGGNWEPREVKGEDASPVGQVARIDPAVVRFDAHRLKARPRPKPVRSALRCSNGRNNSLTFPPGRPPHSSWISISTRSALALTLSVTVVRGRVNLNAFCNRFPTTGGSRSLPSPRHCGSAAFCSTVPFVANAGGVGRNCRRRTPRRARQVIGPAATRDSRTRRRSSGLQRESRDGTSGLLSYVRGLRAIDAVFRPHVSPQFVER